MTVRELIEMLQCENPSDPVLVWDEDQQEWTEAQGLEAPGYMVGVGVK